MSWFETVTDPQRQADALCRRPYGVIETEAGEFSSIRLRPFPKLISWPEVAVAGRWMHERRQGDICRLYYNQPLRHPNYLTLKYVVSMAGASLRTFRRALVVLDEIARIKQSDAIFCDAANLRISDRLLDRWGWEPLAAGGWRRLFIKRFYGSYPPSELGWVAEHCESLAAC